ncbi:hypothetical protein [Bradyrhizobium ottawaense]|uniref:hypothetical protein n=1 Tax=Bradyrhizobium ottawaense TaxID=931866 RepID=UPI0030F3BBCD
MSGPLAIPFRVRSISKDPDERNFVKAIDAVLQEVRMDPAMTRHDLMVTWVLLSTMIERRADVAAISRSDISEKSCLSIGKVRHSLRKLKKTGYFEVVLPSRAEVNEGGWTLKYKAKLDLLNPVELSKAA